MRRWIFVILGLLVSAIFLYLGFRGLDLGQLWAAIQRVEMGWLLLAAVVYFLAAYIITWRWYYLLRPVKDVPPGRLFPLVIVGYMGNNIYPFRIGEVLRAYLLKRREDAPIPATLTTILVERVFDGLTMLAFIFVALLFVEFDAPGIKSGIQILTLLFVAALGVFFGLALRPALARRLYTAILNRLLPALAAERLIGLADNLMDGLATLRSPRALALTFLASLLSWTVEASTYWIVLHAFPFEASFFVVLLMVGLGNLATILPTTPGYVGTFHGVIVLVLQAFGVAQLEAAAYAVLMHGVIWLPVTLAGFIYLVRMGLGLGAFAQAEAAVSAASDARDR
ncbi:MAG: flippase-like domain-containing protein [Anaerolineae bacterium]|nr:flippase-like domain-containing protein [Anaerolineae bacterium]